MIANVFEIELNSPAWAIREGEISVYNFWIRRASLFHEGVGEVVEVLQNLAIAKREHQLEGSDGRNNASYIMWSDHYIVGFSSGGDFFGFEHSTALGQVELANVHAAQLEKLAELIRGVETFTACNRNYSVPSDFL